jgi:hypothetical protein
VRLADIDNDGDLDLFVGTRVMPARYGLPCDQFILQNDGHGRFTDVTAAIAPAFKKLGMVTDARWFDYDQNGFRDLIVVVVWMPVTIFRNDGKQLTRVEGIQGLQKTEGWWNTIEVADLDEDGDVDFVLGNLGMNSKFQPSAERPVTMYLNDFDQNGSTEPIFSYPNEKGEEYPVALRQDIIKQMSSLKKQFVYYKDYAGKSVREIFDEKLLENATVLKFYEPRTSLLMNNGPGDFQLKPLPVQAQVSPVFAARVMDVNHDSHADIVLGGNLFAVKPEIGRYDALLGLVLTGNGKGDFSPVSSQQSGLNLKGEVRHVELIRTKDRTLIAFVRNNDTVKFYGLR